MEKSETSEQGINRAQCKSSNRALEHFSAVLPFSVVEKIVDKPLRIRGVAMAVGMSRNFNVYTPEELQALNTLQTATELRSTAKENRKPLRDTAYLPL